MERDGGGRNYPAVKLQLLFKQNLASTANYGYASHVRKHIAGKKIRTNNFQRHKQADGNFGGKSLE